MATPTEPATDAQDLFNALVPLLQLMHQSRTMSTGKVGILRTLTAEGEASAHILSESLGVSQQGISLAAKELESLGYIERRRDEDDRRKVWFGITPAGVERFNEEVARGRAALLGAIESSLSTDDRNLLRAAIPALTKMSVGVSA